MVDRHCFFLLCILTLYYLFHFFHFSLVFVSFSLLHVYLMFTCLKLQQATLFERRSIRHSHLLHIQKPVRAFVHRGDLPFNPRRRVLHWTPHRYRETEQMKRCADAGVRRHRSCRRIEDHVWKERQDRSIEQGGVFVQKTGLGGWGTVRPTLHRCRERFPCAPRRGRVAVPRPPFLIYVQHREVECGAAAERGKSWFICGHNIPHSCQVGQVEVGNGSLRHCVVRRTLVPLWWPLQWLG